MGNLDAHAVNKNADFVNRQLYSGFTDPDNFKRAGVDSKLFAYGAQFEDRRQSAKVADQDNKDHYHYNIFTVWRLNIFSNRHNSNSCINYVILPITSRNSNEIETFTISNK